MANERTFTLVGNFTDNITPKLTKLNTSVNQLNKSFAKMQKLVRPIAKDMAIMAEASNRISTSFKGQRNAFEGGVKAMRQYRSEMGKVVAAQKKLERNTKLPRITGGGRSGGGDGGGGGGGGGRRGGGSVVGDVISGGLITEAIVRGFDMGAQIIQRAFSYIGQAFSERVGDQLSDIASAGGIFSGAKSAGLKSFGNTMDDAMDVQKDLNRSMAKLAADLPGATNDYVRNARSITDTIMTTLAKSPKTFISEMEKMTGKKGMDERGAVSAATQGIAKSTTLLEKLSPGGGLSQTMLFEDMMARDKVDSKAMQRKYASMKRNPTLVAALERNQEAINKTGAGTAERLAAINKALQEAVPPEMVNMMQRSVDGIKEAFKSAFIDPDTGIFGLSRQMGFMVRQFDTTTGKVRLDKAGKEIQEAVGIFEMLADIVGNIGVVLNNSVIPALSSVLFPFDDLGRSLVDFREYSFRLFEKFQSYTMYFKQLAEKFGVDSGDFKATTRAGMSVLANVFRSMGEISETKYKDLTTRLESKDVKVVDQVGKELLDIFSGSKFVDTITEVIGRVVGGLLDSMADIMEMTIKGADKFAAKGFGKGFTEAGGYSALTRIMANLFKLIWKGFVEALKLWFASIGENLKSMNLGAVLGQIGLTAALLGPFLGGPIKMLLGNLFKAIGVRIAAMNIGGLIAGWLPVFAQAFQTLAAFIGPVIASALKTVLTNAARIAFSAAGITAAIVLALAGLIYVFQDPIKRAITAIRQWVIKNFEGPLREVLVGITNVWTGIVNIIAGVFNGLIALVTLDGARMSRAWQQVSTGIQQFFAGWKQILTNAIGALNQGAGMLRDTVLNFFKAIGQRIWAALTGANVPAGPPTPARNKPIGNGKGGLNKPRGGRAYDGLGGRTMTLGGALASEMRNKPSGSHLVIANSSETVIPAAGGYGMDNLIKTLTAGFNAMVATYKEQSQKQDQTLKGINSTLNNNQKETNARLQKLETKFSSPAMPGGLGGASAGGVDAFTPIAQRMGLTMTSGYRPGDPGWHGANRARDYSNGTGPTPQMMQFAQQLASTYGSRLKELIYTPLGFSIKNGQKVAPYAQSAHYNHVHVAYAGGPGNPAFFPNKRAAENWEKKATMGNVKVSSITANSGEGFGGRSVNVGGITINQMPGQSSEELAAAVIEELNWAIQQAQPATMFV
jgi:hypothetical protein